MNLTQSASKRARHIEDTKTQRNSEAKMKNTNEVLKFNCYQKHNDKYK